MPSSSAKVEARAAPAISNLGSPHLPKIKRMSRITFVETVIIELYVSTFVYVMPTKNERKVRNIYMKNTPGILHFRYDIMFFKTSGDSIVWRRTRGAKR